MPGITTSVTKMSTTSEGSSRICSASSAEPSTSAGSVWPSPGKRAVNEGWGAVLKRHHDGRILSRYPIPAELHDRTIDDDAIWIITDDLADPDTHTAVLWPSDY